MSAFETAQVLEAYQQRCEDRIAVVEAGDRTLIVVADGAGGIGSGDQAAEAVVREVKAAVQVATTADGWSIVLSQADFRVGIGQSTAVVVDLGPQGICGASVGDCQAWLVKEGAITNLTANQRRKPLLGTGEAVPVGFTLDSLVGILIVATDGFCNYIKPAQVIKAIATAEFVALPRTLLSMVRLKSGELWDDVGIVVCRMRPLQRTRQRYSLDPE